MENEIGFGGICRKHDVRDYQLENNGLATSIPVSFFSDVAPFPIKYQGKYGTCGGHAGAALETFLVGKDLSPKYLWKQIKVFDGFGLDDGTDMRSIFKSLQNTGDCLESLCPNDLQSSVEEYSKYDTITDEMLNNAYPNGISNYAFIDNPSFTQIKQAIYKFGAVIGLLDCGTGWYTSKSGNLSWEEKDILPLRLGEFISRHFVVLYGYDDKYIYFRNSWSDRWGAKGNGYFDASYVSHVIEIGTAIKGPSIKQQIITKYITIISLLNMIISYLKEKKGSLGAAGIVLQKGTWQNTAWRTALAVLVIGTPLLTQILPTWQDITLGTIVFAIIHYLEGKVSTN